MRYGFRQSTTVAALLPQPCVSQSRCYTMTPEVGSVGLQGMQQCSCTH